MRKTKTRGAQLSVVTDSAVLYECDAFTALRVHVARVRELSSVQRSLLEMVGEGLSEEGISSRTRRARCSVHTSLYDLCTKLGIPNRSHAVRLRIARQVYGLWQSVARQT